jgi:hypothetical protein
MQQGDESHVEIKRGQQLRLRYGLVLHPPRRPYLSFCPVAGRSQSHDEGQSHFRTRRDHERQLQLSPTRQE